MASQLFRWISVSKQIKELHHPKLIVELKDDFKPEKVTAVRIRLTFTRRSAQRSARLPPDRAHHGQFAAASGKILLRSFSSMKSTPLPPSETKHPEKLLLVMSQGDLG